MLTYNVRGFNTAVKRNKVDSLLRDHGVDIAILTETWLNTHQDISTQDYQVVKSPPCQHQGVAIAFKRSKFDQVKLLHQDLHT